MPNPKSTAQIAGHPLHPMLVPFPIAFFVAAFAVDLTYWQTQNEFWFTASEWLLGVGVIMALLAALAGITDLFGDPRIRALTIAWVHFLANLLAVVIEAINWWLRYQSGGGFVLPAGLVLSLIAVLLLLVTGWLGGELVYRRRVGVLEPPADFGSA
jgi:uncharacterized membrane protein